MAGTLFVPAIKFVDCSVFLFLLALGGCESAETEKSAGIRRVAAEALEQHHCVLCVAGLKNVLLEGCGCLGVEDSFLLEAKPVVGLCRLFLYTMDKFVA